MGKYVDLCDISAVTNKVYTNDSQPTSKQLFKFIEIGEAKFENEVGSFVVPDKPENTYLIKKINGVVVDYSNTQTFTLSEFAENYKDVIVQFTNPITSDEVQLDSENTLEDNDDFSIELTDSLTIISKTTDLTFNIKVIFKNDNEVSFTFIYDISDLADEEVLTEELDPVIEPYTNFTDIVDGMSFGVWLRNRTPLKEIVSIETNIGNRFELNWSDKELKYYISNPEIGKVDLASPIIGDRQYRVSGVYGYEKNELPSIIKQLVMLYVFREYFKADFFNNKNSDVTETIDVDVYREVTRGGSVINGISGIDNLIEKEKANVKNRFRSFIL